MTSGKSALQKLWKGSVDCSSCPPACALTSARREGDGALWTMLLLANTSLGSHDLCSLWFRTRMNQWFEGNQQNIHMQVTLVTSCKNICITILAKTNMLITAICIRWLQIYQILKSSKQSAPSSLVASSVF